MNDTSWQRLMELFERASALPEGERTVFLQKECGEDADLRHKILRMLEEDTRTGDFLEPPERGELERAAGLGSELFAAGTRIGPYTVVRSIGEGGMGVVYEATQESPHRTVALKVMNSRLASAAAARRFRYEAEVLGRLQHPAIAQIHEAGLSRDEATGAELPFFAMEFVEGARTLLQYVREEGLDLGARLRLFREVCDAVTHGHQKGVIHRDLKPANILVDATGRPKVIDFGVARSTDSDVQATTLRTDVRHILGTLQYMSPEQLEGDPRQLDTRSDEYSLGVILYELLCERLPYDVSSKALHEVARVVKETIPQRPSTVHRALKGDLEVIVLTALEKDRERRYESVGALAEDLDRYLDRVPIVARRPSLLHQARLFAARNRTLVAAAVLVLAALVVATGVSARFGLQAERARERVTQHLDEVYRLSDRVLVEEYLAQDEELWPRWPGRVPAMDRWLAAARSLLDRRPEHEAVLQRLEAESSEGEDPHDAEPGVEDTTLTADLRLAAGGARRRWRESTSRDLLARLDALQTLHDQVAARREYADGPMRRVMQEHAEAWEEAIDDIFLSDTYDGLELSPQVGLVPLEPDLDTGLWEFWMPETGERPQRDGDRWRIEGDTGMVFVLIPGGTASVGAQGSNPSEAFHDPWADDDERRHDVELTPFLISRYEMTQGQWLRLTGSNPAYFRRDAEGQVLLHHPVEEVSHEECLRVLPHAGMDLPTEVQWEVAARGGTDTPFWTGTEPRSLEGAANLADLAYAREFQNPRTLEEWLDDGHPRTSPVGHYLPNDFGLHDVSGNVWEWCRELYREQVEPRPGDGLRQGEGEPSGFACLRGAGFANGAFSARPAGRAFDSPGARSDLVGVRPIRPLR